MCVYQTLHAAPSKNKPHLFVFLFFLSFCDSMTSQGSAPIFKSEEIAIAALKGDKHRGAGNRVAGGWMSELHER